MFRPVKRKGTLKLLKLLKTTDEKSKQELLEYIGRLEQSESRLLKSVRSFTRQFDDEESFSLFTEDGKVDQSGSQ